jgi:uncharacterized protein involved in exopolysaccharide biosynthesis
MATLQTLPEATTLLPAGAGAGSATLAARSFLYAVFKHRRLVLGVFLLVFLTSAIVALIRPRTYRASTRVMVKLGEAVQLAPAEAPSRSFFQPLTPEVVNTEAEIVRSRQVIEEAVTRLGVKPESGADMTSIVDGLQLALTVAPTPSSNVLQISFVGRSPEKAANMVNAITDVFLEHHNSVYRNEGVQTFYTEQLNLLDTQMKESQQKLAAYLQDRDIVDVDQEIRILNQDVLEQQKSVKGHRAKIKGVERKFQEVQEQLGRTPTHIAFSEEYQSNPTLTQFKTRLTELEIERTKLLESYLPNHRLVQDVESQIEQLRARLKREQESVLNKRTIQENDLHKELERNLNTLQVNLADLRAREPGMASRLKESKTRLHQLRDERFVVDNLRQVADEKAYSYDLYWRKAEEARIAESMKNQSMVNVSVVERATPPAQPVNGLLLPLLLGLLGGLGLAAALAVAVEYLSRRLRFEEEVERYLELPVLAVIPDLETAPGVGRA